MLPKILSKIILHISLKVLDIEILLLVNKFKFRVSIFEF